MKNKLKTHRYNVAYSDLSHTKNYKLVKDPFLAFAADPFLFFYDGKTYIFAEIFDYRTKKGNIGYSVYNPEKGNFGKWKIVISEKWHLSYPQIFIQDDNIYIVPESGENHSIYLYKAVLFPDIWEKNSILYEGSESFVDTTLFSNNGQKYGFTYCIEGGVVANKGELRLFSIIDGKADISNSRTITNDISHARGGGNVIYLENEYIRVAQDCRLRYGHGLCFHRFQLKNGWEYCEEEVGQIYPEDIHVDKKKHILQVHTYNQLNNMCVIDVGYNEYNLVLLVVRVMLFLKSKTRKIVRLLKRICCCILETVHK